MTNARAEWFHPEVFVLPRHSIVLAAGERIKVLVQQLLDLVGTGGRKVAFVQPRLIGGPAHRALVGVGKDLRQLRLETGAVTQQPLDALALLDQRSLPAL